MSETAEAPARRGPVIAILSRTPNIHIIDLMKADENGVARACYSKCTFEEMKLKHPDAELMELGEAGRLVDEQYVTQPASCTVEQWEEMLNILPPMKWRRGPLGFESFMMCELLCGQITSIYVRRYGADECWTFNDLVSLTHDQIVAKVCASLPKEHACYRPFAATP